MSVLTRIRKHRSAVSVGLFTAFCAVAFGYLWVGSGGHIPLFAPAPSYKVSFATSDLKNLVQAGDVKVAGVTVGQVDGRTLSNGQAAVTIALNSDVVPLHEGVKVQIDVKSLIGSSYVSIVDGTGSAIPSGTTLPAADVVPAVDVDELLTTLDAPTRTHLMSVVQRLSHATSGTGNSLNDTMVGLGQIGKTGPAVLDALAAQSVELQSLTVSAKNLLDQLDVGQGQIATLVSDAQTLTAATASRQAALTQTIQALPGTIAAVDGGAKSLRQLAGPLAPIAADLRAAAPDLGHALQQLPSVTADLNGLVPDLGKTLDEAPATLARLPAFDQTVRAVIPAAQVSLADLNPMLAYLAPYGLDLGQLFASFGGSFDTVAEDGTMPIRLTAMGEGPATVRGIPITLPTLTEWNNPYPKPGMAGKPAPFSGSYPHVQRAPR